MMWLNYAPITSQTRSSWGTRVGLSEFNIVLLALMFPLLYILVSIPAGIIIDRKGYRYAVLVGAVLTAGFGFLRLFAGNYPLVLIGMIGIAVGQPFVSTPSPRWSPPGSLPRSRRSPRAWPPSRSSWA